MTPIADDNTRALEPLMTSRASDDESTVGVNNAANEKPVVVIEPGKSASLVRIRDLWAYRELLYFLIWRDIKVRYKQTLMGVVWVVAQPLLTTVVFTLLFGVLARVPSEGVPYPVFAFAGLLPWTFFAAAVTRGGDSLVGSSQLITKVYFPRIIIPCAAVSAGLLDFTISIGLLAGLMAYYRVSPTFGLLMFPPLILLVTLFALGLGMLLLAWNVRYRDIRTALPILLQIWIFPLHVCHPPT